MLPKLSYMELAIHFQYLFNPGSGSGSDPDLSSQTRYRLPNQINNENDNSTKFTAIGLEKLRDSNNDNHSRDRYGSMSDAAGKLCFRWWREPVRDTIRRSVSGSKTFPAESNTFESVSLGQSPGGSQRDPRLRISSSNSSPTGSYMELPITELPECRLIV